MQSVCSDWLPKVLSLHRDCPYIECPYKESLLYMYNILAAGSDSAGQHDILFYHLEAFCERCQFWPLLTYVGMAAVLCRSA